MSGRYLGEIVRRVLLRMSEESALFGDTLPPKLTIPYILWYLNYICILLLDFDMKLDPKN